jgi:hypothetical protein
MGTAVQRKKKVGRKPGTAVDTPALRKQFLATLAATGNVGVASEACKLYRTTPYQWKKKDPEFSKQWDEALDSAADAAEEEVRRRAVDGWEEPVFYQGEVVGHTRKFSDRMLELYIKALRPEKFREKQIGDGAVLIQINGMDNVKALRESNPWGSDNSAQALGQGETFTPILVQVEDLKTDRKGVAVMAGRAHNGNVGLTEAEKYEDE